ncbi:MAG: helix-turn-helix domain-containing protein, partial [Acidobacteriales bacterium]|nr:helix-turn-helix domain-containing protein [Terriglobales bacterium]
MSFNKDNLCRARELRSLSKTDLAKLVRTTHQNVSNWESGARVPKVEMVRRMARALGVPLDTLDPDFAADLATLPGLGAAEHSAASHPCAGRPPWLTELCRHWDQVPYATQKVLEAASLAAIEKSTREVTHK